MVRRGPLGRLRYARAYFNALDAQQRRARLEVWLLKPGLGDRALHFLFPRAGQARPRRRPGIPSRRGRTDSARAVSSWDHARDLNLADVEEVLRKAEIPYAVIDAASPMRTQVGVDVADKQRVIAAFDRFGDRRGHLAGVPWTDQVRTSREPRSRLSSYLLRRRLEMSTSFVWWQPTSIGERGRVFDLDVGTEISFWAPSVDQDGITKLFGSAPNLWSTVVPSCDDSEADVPTVLSRALTGRTPIEAIDFPIDLVCLWVDGSDPEWNRRRRERLIQSRAGLSADATQPHLFRDREELRYALRSIRQFAPFIRHVYLVTDRQTPRWLDTTAAGLTVVDHSEIFPADALPVFNSNAIDTQLHNIEGLTEHFLVTNDDMMFLNPVLPEDFFTASGQMKMFLSRARIPVGPPVPGEPGVDSAAKTNRDLIEAAHGITISRKFKHIMIAQRRSVRDRVAATYSSAVEATARHPFREMNDVSFSHLCLYDALRTGDAVVANLAYDYVSLGDPAFDQRLTHLERQPEAVKVLCLNDGDASAVVDAHGRAQGSIPVDPTVRDARLARFLDTLLPTPCEWELGAIEDSYALDPEDPT